MKKQQKTLTLAPHDLILWVILGIAVIGLSGGYGYFWGRYEQIQLNRSVLKAIPDVNCSQEVH